MSRTRQYLGYGVLIDSDVELGPYLRESNRGRCRFQLRRRHGIEDEPGFDHEFYLFKAHGRPVTGFTDGPMDKLQPGERARLDIGKILSFEWKSGADTIEYRLLDESAGNLLPFWFLHIILPIFLANQRVYEFLHAAAVEIDEKAILIVAPSLGGKSTTAQYFVTQGHGLISDDKLAAFQEGERYMVVPSHGFMRPYRAFEVLGQPAACTADGPKPVHGIFNLERVAADKPVDILPMQGVASFRQLIPNYMYRSNAHSARHMKFLTGLLNSAPSYKVQVPEDLNRLHEVYRAILNQVRYGASTSVRPSNGSSDT